jgi:hypothetical protein
LGHSDVNWKITPAEFLSELGWTNKRRGNWLTMVICPFCNGGDHKDKLTFIVHAKDGNYSCSRAKCGSRGSFWGLMLAVGKDPKEFLGERIEMMRPRKKKQTKKGYVYGR